MPANVQTFAKGFFSISLAHWPKKKPFVKVMLAEDFSYFSLHTIQVLALMRAFAKELGAKNKKRF